ncbi:MAG: recombinase family protein [Alphaproteobacteria bacterium HGW-Alphaproteobacteria-8]|nr:MAG: recombinase family protein [Alphaproteobacteria bacterium HGW-Alphaproteobacteria-8]
MVEGYDDGGISGGTLERPALQRLLADIDVGRVDQIVVYKIDRLTRSLADFAKIVDRLDAAGTAFVSVTQSFNTATSMGRLTLNMLLSFAQFEREVTAERIRDKIAASKQKGLWMGGNVPLGYAPDGRTLRIVPEEARVIQALYDLYLERGTVRATCAAAAERGYLSKQRHSSSGRHSGGTPLGRGHIHQILTNPLYAGRIRHRRKVFEGQHPAIIAPDLWEQVQVLLQQDASKPRQRTAPSSISLLAGKLFDETQDRLTPTHAKTKSGKRLRYYVSHRLIARSGERDISGWRLPASELETAIERLLIDWIKAPGFAARLLPQATAEQIGDLQRRCSRLADARTEAYDRSRPFTLIERIDLRPGQVAISIDPAALAAELGIAQSDLAVQPLQITAPFKSRKRGVETKLILGAEMPLIDRTLLANLAKAQVWLEYIKSGKSCDAIAASAGTSKRRVQQMLDLAFLAPDIAKSIVEGRQPLGLTSDWLKLHRLPTRWEDQLALVSTL